MRVAIFLIALFYVFSIYTMEKEGPLSLSLMCSDDTTVKISKEKLGPFLKTFQGAKNLAECLNESNLKWPLPPGISKVDVENVLPLLDKLNKAGACKTYIKNFISKYPADQSTKFLHLLDYLCFDKAILNKGWSHWIIAELKHNSISEILKNVPLRQAIVALPSTVSNGVARQYGSLEVGQILPALLPNNGQKNQFNIRWIQVTSATFSHCSSLRSFSPKNTSFGVA